MTFTSTKPGPGHNSGSIPEHGHDEAAVEGLHRVGDEIAAWSLDVTPSTAATVSGLKPYERLLAQRNAWMRQTVRLVRASKEDAAPGILALIAAFSDNEHGRCTLSVPRIARILRRDVRSVERRIAKLIEDGYLGRDRIAANASATWVLMSSFDISMKPTDVLPLLDPQGGLAPRRAVPGSVGVTPAPDAGVDTDGTPARDAGVEVHTPALDAPPPRHWTGGTPALGFGNPYEIVEEPRHTTALGTQLSKNTTTAAATALQTSEPSEGPINVSMPGGTEDDEPFVIVGPTHERCAEVLTLAREQLAEAGLGEEFLPRLLEHMERHAQFVFALSTTDRWAERDGEAVSGEVLRCAYRSMPGELRNALGQQELDAAAEIVRGYLGPVNADRVIVAIRRAVLGVELPLAITAACRPSSAVPGESSLVEAITAALRRGVPPDTIHDDLLQAAADAEPARTISTAVRYVRQSRVAA